MSRIEQCFHIEDNEPRIIEIIEAIIRYSPYVRRKGTVGRFATRRIMALRRELVELGGQI